MTHGHDIPYRILYGILTFYRDVKMAQYSQISPSAYTSTPSGTAYRFDFDCLEPFSISFCFFDQNRIKTQKKADDVGLFFIYPYGSLLPALL